MTGRLDIDFVVFLGDPDAGAKAVASRKLLEPSASRDGVRWLDAYGAIVVSKNGEELIERIPDPIFKLVSHMVRAVNSLIDGESETVELTESEHGFLFEPSGEDVVVSFFTGSAFDPEEYLLTEEQLPIEVFAQQVIDMGQRLRDLVKLTDPGLFDSDEYSQSLIQFLDMSTRALKALKREKERGLR